MYYNILKKFFNYIIDEKSALHIAVEKENIEVIKLLLNQKEINVNAKDEINCENLSIKFVQIFYGFSFWNFWRKPVELSDSSEIKELFNQLTQKK